LLDRVWEYDGTPLTRTVDMHVAKLRKKIEADPADPKHIVTVHRMGYKFTG
jgi:DNA-binding response OmpR family regulator